MKRLQKSLVDKKLFGVCGGIAEYFEVDPVLVRVAFVAVTLGTSLPGFLIYLGLTVAMPKPAGMIESN